MVLPTPPFPITITRPWPHAASSSISELSRGRGGSASADTLRVSNADAPSSSKAGRAGRPTMLKARSGTCRVGRPRSRAGVSRTACWPRGREGVSRTASWPRCSRAMATGSARAVASNTASPDVGFASRSAARSGRVTSTLVVRSASPSASSAAKNRGPCIFGPECGPRHDAPWVVDWRKPVQARGRLRRRSVCPVGAVSKST